MNNIWNESRIREELQRLDQKTGLSGAKLPIVFNNAKCSLGCFSIDEDEPKRFCFSNYYFQDENFPYEEAIDTIKHEYAHYMDYVLYGGLGHEASWRQCCLRIGALPFRLYSEERASYYRKKHEALLREQGMLDRFLPGTVVEHPRFGRGEVLCSSGADQGRVLQIVFSKVGRKMLNASWVLNNCKHPWMDKER